MTISPDYSIATNMAYRVLGQCTEFTLPIYVKNIIKRYPDIRVLTYSEAESKYGLCFDVLVECNKHGFTMIWNGRRVILYNEKKDLQIIRFTMAHELGHCILGHVSDNGISDKEANCFARNILCPIPIVRELEIKTIDDYIEYFAVSEPMATASMDFACYDYDLIDEELYAKMKDLLTCHMTGYALSELYDDYPNNVVSISRRQEDSIYTQDPATINASATTYLKGGYSAFIEEEERELLDRLKFGE